MNSYSPKFTSEEYNSNDGMSTMVWGSSMWFSLHTISFNYPVNPSQNDKNDYYNYILSLTKVLPCRACRDNLDKNLKEIKFGMDHMKNREIFSRFIYDLHNHVNRMLGKPNYKTYEEVRDQYEMFRARCVNNTPVELKHKPGCVLPNNGIKSRCIINIVPAEIGGDSLIIDKRCSPKSGGFKKNTPYLKKASRKPSRKTSRKISRKPSSKNKK